VAAATASSSLLGTTSPSLLGTTRRKGLTIINTIFLGWFDYRCSVAVQWRLLQRIPTDRPLSCDSNGALNLSVAPEVAEICQFPCHQMVFLFFTIFLGWFDCRFSVAVKWRLLRRISTDRPLSCASNGALNLSVAPEVAEICQFPCHQMVFLLALQESYCGCGGHCR